MKVYFSKKSFVMILTIFILTGNRLYPQSGFINGSPKIAYWKEGSESTILIVLHGGPSAAHGYLLPEWNILSSAATVIFYDQRGCGKSEIAQCYSWKEHVEDLKRLIGQVANGKKVILAGSSWGSTLALLYTQRFPRDVNGLILSGTYNWIGKGEPEKPCADYQINPMRSSLRDVGSFKVLEMLDTDSNKLRHKIIEVHHVSHSMTNASMRFAPALDDLKKITQPVLIFKGGGNCQEVRPKEGADIYGAILPKAEISTIEGACHDPWITHTKEFFSRCVAFIHVHGERKKRY